MKKTFRVPLSIFIIPVIILLNGCQWQQLDELEEVTTPLDYKQILGTYIFQPKSYEAQKLKIKTGDTVILTITYNSLKAAKSKEYYRGEYSINKMILVTSDDSNKPYEGIWLFFSRKDFARKGVFSNRISFNQNVTNSNDISFNIEKRLSDTLHIVGYTADPKYEVIKVIDFKKIK